MISIISIVLSILDNILNKLLYIINKLSTGNLDYRSIERLQIKLDICSDSIIKLHDKLSEKVLVSIDSTEKENNNE